MKNIIQRIFRAVPGLFIAFIICPIISLEAAQREVKVAVLPFDISSAGQFSFVGHAIEEVLSSSLANMASEGMSVMDSFEIRDITGKKQGAISFPDIREMAGKLKVDYFITGKLISEGEHITIDMNMLQVDSESPLYSLIFSPLSLNEVPPRIEDFTTQAVKQIMNVPESVKAESEIKDGQKVPQKLSQEETTKNENLVIARMHPDLLVKKADMDSSKLEQIPDLSAGELYTRGLPPMPPEQILLQPFPACRRKPRPQIKKIKKAGFPGSENHGGARIRLFKMQLLPQYFRINHEKSRLRKTELPVLSLRDQILSSPF
ncbi:MAG: hypothetical protein AVO38_02140 [delta proteobacterium ML8_D]|nr:MAG: hypothetical protein AVO38_02140 [delta proteobacterium ML8_D]